MATRHIRPYPIKLNPDQQDKMTDQELEAGLAPVYLNPALVASLLLMGYQDLGEGQIGHFVGLGPTQQVGQVLGDVGAADVAILRAICSMEVIKTPPAPTGVPRHSHSAGRCPLWGATADSRVDRRTARGRRHRPRMLISMQN